MYYFSIDYKYIVLDEIFTSIDILTKNKIFPLLNELLKDKSCIFVSHDLEEISYFCDSIVAIENNGKIFSGNFNEAKNGSIFFSGMLSKKEN